MREILFRGQRTDNSEWVEGYLYRTHNGEYEIGFYNAETNIERMSYVVIPETIGQYTGLTDKNGKRIFEGDIVRAKRINTDKSYLGDVIWWLGCFAIQETKTQNVPAIDLFYEYEVIGNIHDNPELLKGTD